MKRLIFLLLTFVCLYSCQESEFSNSDKRASEYLPLSIGNYWIYQKFTINPDGTEKAELVFDSVSIKRDTIINGQQYFEIVKSNLISLQSYFQKDSSGCLVTLEIGPNKNVLNHYVLFSDNNTDTLYKSIYKPEMDTVYSISVKMEKLKQPISVPAGTFEVLNAKHTVIANPKYTYYVGPRYNNNYYAKNIGQILYSYHYLNNLGQIEYRLIRYSVKQN